MNMNWIAAGIFGGAFALAGCATETAPPPERLGESKQAESDPSDYEGSGCDYLQCPNATVPARTEWGTCDCRPPEPPNPCSRWDEYGRYWCPPPDDTLYCHMTEEGYWICGG